MKVRVLSDTHLESYDDFTRVIAKINCKFGEICSREILVLPGDLGYVCDKDGNFNPEYEKFLRFVRAKWNYVVIVPGNTEYHGMRNFESLVETEALLEKKCKELDITYLQKGVAKYGDYFFVGCTLWSFTSQKEWNKLKQEDRDIFMDNGIYRMSYVDHLEWLDSILKELKRMGEKAVVITHYPPMTSYKKIEFKWEKDGVMHESDHIQHFMWEYKDVIKTWICGHVHDRHSLKDASVEVFINSMGEADESLKMNNGIINL